MVNWLKLKFDEETINRLDKRDGVIGIVYYVFYMLMVFLFGLFTFNTPVYDNLSQYFASKTLFRFLFYIPFVIICILPILIITGVKNQGLGSLGLKKGNIWQQILIGIIGAIPFSIGNILGAMNAGKKLNGNPADWLWTFLYFFICIAFTEELIFRGYLQTRIQGLIRNKWVGMVVVGLLFGLLHIPFQMMRAGMSFFEFIAYDAPHLINTVIMHVYFTYLYTRDNNLLAPTLAHTIMNMCYDIFI